MGSSQFAWFRPGFPWFSPGFAWEVLTICLVSPWFPLVWARFRLRRPQNLPGLALVWPGLGPVSPETSSESALFGLVWARFRLRRPQNLPPFALVWPGLGAVLLETLLAH